LGLSNVNTLHETGASQPVIHYMGRELTQAETLGLRPKLSLGQTSLPLILASWVALVLVVTTSLGGFAAVAFGPAALTFVDRMRRV